MHRAKKICNTQQSFQKEKERIKKLLVNNNFPNSLIDSIMKKFIAMPQPDNTAGNNQRSPRTNTSQSIGNSDTGGSVGDEPRDVNIFYQNQYHDKYNLDEEAIKKIIKHHVLQLKVKIKLLIYYKSPKVSNLIMKNNLTRAPDGDRSGMKLHAC